MESNNNHDTAIAAAVILSISCVQQVYAKYTYTVIYMYTYIQVWNFLTEKKMDTSCYFLVNTITVL